MRDFGFTAAERRVLQKLNTPAKIQDFLNAMPFNCEKNGDTCMSPLRVLVAGRAQCMEGAMFAAAALRLLGHPPLIVDLESTDDDFDHVIAVFKKKGRWGAISKTNHAVLRYREPVYRSVRELVMSYFHEYFLDDGRKTLRSFSRPVNLARFDDRNWMTSENDVWFVPEHLCDVRHFPILTRAHVAALRPADDVEIRAGKIIEWS
jgi:hypothetical protein